MVQKKKNLKPYFVTILMLLLLGGLTYFYIQDGVKQKALERQKYVIKENPSEISQINIAYNRKNFALVREENRWLLRRWKGLYVPAATEMLNDFTSILSSIEKLNPIENPMSSEQKHMGLRYPSLILSFTIGDKDHTLTVGKKNDLDKSYYAKHNDDPLIFSIPENVVERFHLAEDDLRERDILEMDSDHLQSIQLDLPNQQFAFTKEEDDLWYLTMPARHLASQKKVEDLISSFDEMSVINFVTDVPKNLRLYGLYNPSLSVSFTNQHDEQMVLYFGIKRKDKQFLKTSFSDSVYAVQSDFIKEFDKTIYYWRDKVLTHVPIDEVNNIEMKNSTGSIQFIKRKERWVEKENREEGRQFLMSQFLTVITQQNAIYFINKKPHFLDEFEYIQFKISSKKDQLEDISFYFDNKKPLVYVAVSRFPNELLIINKQTLEVINPLFKLLQKEEAPQN